MDYLTFLFSICRFVTVLVYYGLSLGVSDLGTNIYLTQFLFGLVEVPARSLALLCLPHSRRLSQSMFLAIGGAACLLMFIVPEGESIFILFFFLTIKTSQALLYSFKLSLPFYGLMLSDPLYIIIHVITICSLFASISLTLSFHFATLTDSPNVKAAVAMSGKFGITASFAVIYVYTAELFPTVLRYLLKHIYTITNNNLSVLYLLCAK